jgi:hypothetical protein
MVTQHIMLEEQLRDIVLTLLRQGYDFDQMMLALQNIKVELALASKYAQAMSDSSFSP